MSKPRYYSEESQILAAIDRTQKRIAVRRRLAVIWNNRWLDRHRAGDSSEQQRVALIARDNSEHYFRLAQQIEATTLRKLKEKLAEFRTVPMEGVGQLEVRVR